MEKILEFEINNKIYSIWDVDYIDGRSSYIGETRYEQGLIYIEKGKKNDMIDTVKHELAHVWLYENGHPYQSGGCFTYEDLCEYIAFSSSSVINIANEYMKKKGWLK